MQPLDHYVAEAARGGLHGLTLYRVADGRWQASRTLDGVGWRSAVSRDPTEAIRAVLGTSGVSEMAADTTSIFD